VSVAGYLDSQSPGESAGGNGMVPGNIAGHIISGDPMCRREEPSMSPAASPSTGNIRMGRIRSEIEVDGRHLWTLFDSGARNSYITREAARGLDVKLLPKPRQAMLGGGTHSVNEACLIPASMGGRTLAFQASVIDEIGIDKEGRTIEVFFGALAMPLWGIRLDPPNERLDFTHFTRDFLEF
jgi:hypothetical protein